MATYWISGHLDLTADEFLQHYAPEILKAATLPANRFVVGDAPGCDDMAIQLLTKVNDHEFELTVCDEGIGIPVEDQPHLFERFFRAGNAGTIQGTGLGLPLVVKIARGHGGRLDVRTAPGQGCHAQLVLPMRHADGPGFVPA